MMIAKFLLRFTPYVKCTDCNKSGLAKREISILNLGLYAILGVIVYFVLNAFEFGAFAIIIGVLTVIALAFVNVYYAKPKCQFCSSLNVLIIPYPHKTDNDDEVIKAEVLEESTEDGTKPVEEMTEPDQTTDI